jgi:hypothetical protein
VNGVFRARDEGDPVAVAMAARGRAALDAMPPPLRALPRVDVPLLPVRPGRDRGAARDGRADRRRRDRAAPADLDPGLRRRASTR